MIAYNIEGLKHLLIRQQASDAFDQQLLEKPELDDINKKYPSFFYTPNFFIRIGLFLLTVIILLFSFGLFTLLFLNSIENTIGGLAIFFGLVSYGGLEYMVQTKKHLQSGVDDALMWIAAGSFFGGISFLFNAGGLANSFLVCIIAGYCSLRFADRLMTVVCYVALLGVLFFACVRMGPVAKAVVPFVIMVIALIVYFLAKKIGRMRTNLLYYNCLQLLTVAALLSFYFAGNYYVVRELSAAMFNLGLADNTPIPMGWLFWMFTTIIPLVYILLGIQQKDILLIRVGLVLVAAIVFTTRYYYAFASIEPLMTICGACLILISYGLTKYLKTAKFGFTNAEIVGGEQENLQLEALLQAQTFTTPTVADGTRFGGGSFGGGGSSGEF